LAIIDLGSLQVLCVEVLIEVAATVDLSLKLFSGHLFQVEVMTETGPLFIFPYDDHFYGFRWYLGTVNGQT